MRNWKTTLGVVVGVLAVGSLLAYAEDVPGESGALPTVRISQSEIASGAATRDRIRLMGMRLFTTPMNRLDGYGDGPMNPEDTVSPGGRPTLQGNGTFLRINGLDAQSCLECHSVVRANTIPPSLGIGGVGGSNSNAIIAPTDMDPADLEDLDGKANFNGRFANPPFLFGAGGVELLGLEMTADLQRLKQEALDNPGTPIDLITKGVDFGTLQADENGVLDTSGVMGVDADLVIRPFGRKGEFASVREFDQGAVQFHLGMQPTEIVGEDVDADGDGVMNEIRPGDLSAISLFIATLERPYGEKLRGAARRGLDSFKEVGCAECHKPKLRTERRRLPLRFPEVATAPWENAYLNVDLSRAPPRFERVKKGGLIVPLFADLKRHDMGEGLKEDFARGSDPINRRFTTARLWGIADTAPYLHDGRATTLTDAITAHGGEAQSARDAFVALGDESKVDLLTFLRSLRTPREPAKDLLRMKRAKSDKSAKARRGGKHRK